jgi:hypothetical protein
LIDALCQDEEGPWAKYDYRRGAPITARQISAKLKEFGIEAKNLILPGGQRPKGFERAQFEDAWSRYLSVKGSSEPQKSSSEPPLELPELPLATSELFHKTLKRNEKVQKVAQEGGISGEVSRSTPPVTGRRELRI